MKPLDKIHLPELESCPMPMKLRSAIKKDLFAADQRREKIDRLGDPFLAFEVHTDFVVLAKAVDRLAPRPESLQGGRPPVPTETMMRVLFLKRCNNLSDKQMEY